MFSEVFQGHYGDTVRSKNPEADARKEAARFRRCDFRTSLTFREDGAVTVEVAGGGVAPITFQPEHRPQTF